MAAYEDYRAQRTFGSLDGVRCMSIVAVVWHHSHHDLSIGRISSRGFLGVDMFFVLSGFLIVTLLLRERDRNGEISLKAFYARRSLRIFPLYYGVVIATAIGAFLFLPEGKTAQSMWHALPILLTYTSNWFQVHNFLDITWSLATEEQFYLFWPPLQKYLRHTVWLLVALITMGHLIHIGLFDSTLAEWGASPETILTIRHSPFTPILLGVLLAHGLHNRQSFGFIARIASFKAAPLVCLVLLLLCAEVMPEDLTGWPRFAIHLVMTALLATLVVREDNVFAPILKWAPVVRIGVLSYGMYLLHMFVVHVADQLWEQGYLPTVTLFPLVLLGTVVIAELSFRYYETPFLQLKKRFAR